MLVVDIARQYSKVVDIVRAKTLTPYNKLFKEKTSSVQDFFKSKQQQYL